MPGDPVLIRVSVTDISERQRYQREIERLAFSDELTGLPNRRLLLDRLNQAVAASVRHNVHGALVFIDLDGFKTINDRLGHATGDAALTHLATLAREAMRPQDTLARYGGEEFAVTLPFTSKAAYEEVSSNIVSAVRALAIPHEKNEWGVTTISVGGAYLDAANGDLSHVFRQADERLYRAKAQGRNQAVV